MADEVVRPQVEVPFQGFGDDPPVPQPQRNVSDEPLPSEEESNFVSTIDARESEAESNFRAIPGMIQTTRSSATAADARNAAMSKDWRVKLSLAKRADYLYMAKESPGILAPLVATKGVIFPYTPQIQVTYAAHYDGSELTHSNYKIFQYKSSSVDSIQITCTFTAQDTIEANYLLAVIHFFRAATKMFYGQDSRPKAGTPPPLCYLSGLGQFQFNNHPLVINNFTYSLPDDVDYIRATTFPGTTPGQRTSSGGAGYSESPSDVRAKTQGVPINGNLAYKVSPNSNSSGTIEPTYVPTKIQLSIAAYPIVTRNDISNEFSFQKYASGALLNRPNGGGMW